MLFKCKIGSVFLDWDYAQLGVFIKPYKLQKLHQNRQENGITAPHYN